MDLDLALAFGLGSSSSCNRYSLSVAINLVNCLVLTPTLGMIVSLLTRLIASANCATASLTSSFDLSNSGPIKAWMSAAPTHASIPPNVRSLVMACLTFRPPVTAFRRAPPASSAPLTASAAMALS